MGKAATRTRHNRTMTVDFHDETTDFKLLDDRKAFVEFVLAFLLALGFQLKHQATCGGGGCLTRHSHDVRVRLGGAIIWRLQCTTGKAVFTVLVWSKNSRGLSFVVFEQPAKPFTTLNRTLPLRVLADCRKEPHVAFALMIPLVMIVVHILMEHMA
jgi:hypothetical protein